MARSVGSSAARFRRALGLVAMTVVLPGSAQLMAGDRRVGRIAMRAAAAALTFVVVLALMALWRQRQLVTLLTSDSFLLVLRIGLVATALGWTYLVVDAWRIAQPLTLDRGHRLWVTGVNGMVCFGLSGGLLFASHLVAVHQDFLRTVFGASSASGPHEGRYNVLLLGGDAGPRRVGMRPDSITVASIDAETGRAVLFGLPRNLADVPFPAGSPMAAKFPDGFDCDGCYLNGVYTWAEDHAQLYPGVRHPGVAATTDAVEAVTGLAINYYVLVDLKGFADLVDAAGGVTVHVPERLPIGGVGAPITGWIEAGRQHLDGQQALWFARSRATSDDYSRMSRQKCLMSAMLHQLDPARVVTHFGDIAAAGKQVISTSIPAGELDTFIGLAHKGARLPIRTVSFVPPRVDTSAPDYAEIHALVSRVVDGPDRKSAGDSGPSVRRSATRQRDGNSAADLDRAC